MEIPDIKFDADTEKRLWKARNISKNDFEQMFKGIYSSTGRRLLKIAIAKCISNSLRLEKDAQNISKPSSAALLELGMEEANKAYTIAHIYNGLFNPNRPSELTKLTDEEEMLLIYLHICLLHDVLKTHNIKAPLGAMADKAIHDNPMVFEKNSIKRYQEEGMSESDINAMKISLKAYTDNLLVMHPPINFNRIKKNGFYVDIDFMNLKLIIPSAFTQHEINEIQRNAKLARAEAQRSLDFFGAAGI